MNLSGKYGTKRQCLLCPHFCKLKEGQSGICGVRRNTGSNIELTTYGVLSGYALDPIEKKPLYHFYPGTGILSVGSFGCNMRCDFCQNYTISQYSPPGSFSVTEPAKIIKDAQTSANNIGIAFTYNEPSIMFEYVRDVSIPARKKGLLTVMVSNGYINPEPLKELISFTDAFNVDLKAFNNDFYRKLTGAELAPVLNTLKQIARSGKHLEITTLIIPGYNDKISEMEAEAEWIAGELGRNVPLHLSRYYPMYKRNEPVTPKATIDSLVTAASKHLQYVYSGNINSETGANTYCPGCGNCVTTRSGYSIKTHGLDSYGKCLNCGTSVYRHFIYKPSTRRD